MDLVKNYRKKPVVIEAVQWTGDRACLTGTVFEPYFHAGAIQRIDKALPIKTLEGEMLCSVGDWIIQGVKGELYPCRADIFAATYDLAEANDDNVTISKEEYDRLKACWDQRTEALAALNAALGGK